MKLASNQLPSVLLAGLLGTAPWACSKNAPEKASDPDGEPLPHDHDGHSHDLEAGGAGGFGGQGQGTGLGGAVDSYKWAVPPGFPIPWQPDDNPTTEAKVELGRHLFYDERLSDNDTMSCATCHKQELAFTDGLQTSIGSTGETLPRNSMTLANVGYASTLTWGHPLLYELERQALIPMFGETPIELGLPDAAAIEEKLADDPLYQALFLAAFPDAAQRGTLAQMTRSLAAFQRTLISGDSPYDRWLAGDEDAISLAAQRGYTLFNSEKMECFHCHVGFNLSDHTNWLDKPFFDAPFHNTGLYNLDNSESYPEPNTGVHSVTSNPADMGRFKAPTLRNIAVTAPYMHDGSIATLGEVLDHYAAGGRKIEAGPYAGDGSANPRKSNLIAGFELSDQERSDVIAFLESLTDEGLLTNPAYSNPWEQ